MQGQRVLPAIVFDFMELSAEAFGGIGGGSYGNYGYLDGAAAPTCAIGIARVAKTPENAEVFAYFPEPESALRAALIDESANDNAVARVNKRRGVPRSGARIPFALWAAALNVVRGN